MKLLVHDYSGHPFQAQLSRELARRGHTVQHAYCSSYVSGKGKLARTPDDPPNLSFAPLGLATPFDKYSLFRRLAQERAYAKKFVTLAAASRPDMIINCNVPLVAHALIKRRMIVAGIPTAFWHQDLYSHAIRAEARRRLGPLGHFVGRRAERAEAWIARQAAAVIAISDQFVPIHTQWGTEPGKLHVIPNWGPVDEVQPRPRDNDWARDHDLVGRRVLLYSGTLGLKHDAHQLLTLLRGVRAKLDDAVLVVVSDGPAAEQLRDAEEPGLKVLPFQPFDRLPEVLSAGDLLVTILEPEASAYSVPSKTLTYLCAGRPVVALLPRSNPAFGIVSDAGGLPIDLADVGMNEAVSAVAALLDDPVELERRGRLARAFAEATFDIVQLTDRFEAALGVGRTGRSSEQRMGRGHIDDSEVSTA